MMYHCDHCGEEVSDFTEIDTCQYCGYEYCSNCGVVGSGQCIYCVAEDDDDWD